MELETFFFFVVCGWGKMMLSTTTWFGVREEKGEDDRVRGNKNNVERVQVSHMIWIGHSKSKNSSQNYMNFF